MNAIPTTYRGINFRSRLEARWAAFFNALGWRYEYEPRDLKGYIPDFFLYVGREPVLVEVKPFDLPDPEKLVPDLGQHPSRHVFEKIVTSGWGGPAVVVGETTSSHSRGVRMGVGRFVASGESMVADVFHCSRCFSLPSKRQESLCLLFTLWPSRDHPDYMRSVCASCQHCGRVWSIVGEGKGVPDIGQDAVSAWAAACNEVQWCARPAFPNAVAGPPVPKRKADLRGGSVTVAHLGKENFP